MLILFNTYLYILLSLIGGFIIDVGHRILADLTLRSYKWSLIKRRRLLSLEIFIILGIQFNLIYLNFIHLLLFNHYILILKLQCFAINSRLMALDTI